jgi:tripartite ATP-independent transporter DctM subunit
MSIGIIAVLMFLLLILLMIVGLPIAFCLGSVGIIFTYFFWGPASLALVSTNLYGFMSDFILLAIPLFVFMANMLQHSGVAENLYETMHKWFGPVRGGLAIGTVAICAVIAAMSGLSAAGTLSTGIVALPAMMKRKYDKSIAIGSVSAGGALGALIPPSVPMVVYSFLASVSVGRMFLGGILPGIMLSLFYILYISIRSLVSPDLCPALKSEERASWDEKIKALKLVILPILLIAAVLGSIFTGMATPTEAAAVGAFGSIICSLINGKLTWYNLRDSAYGTLKLTAMLMWIMAAAAVFNSIFTGLGASQLISETLVKFELSPWLIIIGMQFTLFLLGMIMDPNGIMMITIPIYVPIITTLGFDPVWFGILYIINIEIAYLTPPFGWNIFYLKSIAPEGITLLDIYKSVIIFVALQIVGLLLVMIFPQLALMLPDIVMGAGR